MNDIEEKLEKQFKLLENMKKGMFTPFLHNFIAIRRMNEKYAVNMEIEKYTTKRRFSNSKVEFMATKDELWDILNYILKHDKIIIVGAPTEKYNPSHTNIVGYRSQILFDDAEQYSELIDSANSSALLKDSLTNSNKVIEGEIYQSWHVLPVETFLLLPPVMIALQKCYCVLEPVGKEIEPEEWLDKRVMNLEEKAEKYLINYNRTEDNYFVKRNPEKVKKNINRGLYN